MNKEQLKNFALNEDYAFCQNADLMCANDQPVREAIADIIENADTIEEAECADLASEVMNGCIVYKISGTEIPDTWIAYYE